MRALALLALAGPALAQEARFAPPAGCEAFLTVQRADCRVTHHYACAGDPPGSQRFTWIDDRGVALTGLIDRETQWVETTYLTTAHTERLLPDPADPASLDGLLATGRDSWDFRTASDEIGETRYVGEDRLTGERVVVDGLALERTSFDIVAEDGAGVEVWRQRGSQFVSRDLRLFFSDRAVTEIPTGEGTVTEVSEARPLEVARPGEEGFLALAPRHGCGALLSGALAMEPPHG